MIVRTDLGQSIQNAVNTATDSNHDGFVIVGVVNNGSGNLGGSTNQRVTIDQVYPKPFLLIGCSVTMIDPDISQPTGWIKIGAGATGGNIFVMDLHGTGSGVAGWKVDGDGRELRNVGTSNNAVGVWFNSNNNVMHNGATTSNSGIGLRIDGNGNVATDTDVFSNSSHGVQVTGNSNQLLKINTGKKNQGNGGDGMTVSGNGNLIQEVDAYANTGNGISATGAGNTLNKNVSGDRGTGNGGAGFLVSGGATLLQNTAIANTGDGFHLLTSGFSLKNNVSGGSGTGYANSGCQYRFDVLGNTNGGGNKTNGATLSGSLLGCK